MEDKIKKIFNRQYQRMFSALKPLNVAEPIIDTFSKYFRFTEIDITDLLNKIKETKEDKGNGNYNR